MSRQRNTARHRLLLGALLVTMLATCANNIPTYSPGTTAQDNTSATPVSRNAGLAPSLQNPTLPAGQTTTEQPVVRIWWPDELYPQHSEVAADILLGQFESFRLTYTTYDLDVRRKRIYGLGGILATLRTAIPVAPGALPDLTLMRRADMITAATEGLIMPLDDWIPPDLAGNNLIDGTRALGEIDGTLYGVPYALNINHTAYRASVFEAPLLSFDDVLTQEPAYSFPAGIAPVNWTLLLQYLAARGRLVDEGGLATLDREPLIAVLDYYAQGVRQGIFSPALLDYTAFDMAWQHFVSAEINLIGVDSVTYLNQQESVQNVGLAPLPTLGETPVAALDGWLWVLTTHDPDQQQHARTFLSWMLRISQQSAYTEAFGILPSQSRALRLWENETYADFAQSLFASAEVIPVAQRNNRAAIALQESLIAVLEGTGAGVAADAALAKFAE